MGRLGVERVGGFCGQRACERSSPQHQCGQPLSLDLGVPCICGLIRWLYYHELVVIVLVNNYIG